MHTVKLTIDQIVSGAIMAAAIAAVLLAIGSVADAQQNQVSIQATATELRVQFTLYGPEDIEPGQGWPDFRIGDLRTHTNGDRVFATWSRNGQYRWAHVHKAGSARVVDRVRDSGQFHVNGPKLQDGRNAPLPIVWTRQFMSEDSGGRLVHRGYFYCYRR